MSKINIWNKYIKKGNIGSGLFSKVYKAINMSKGNYVAIKEIDKSKYNELTNSNFDINKIIKINSENSILIYETIDTDDYFYIISELCLCNLEEFLKIRKHPLTIKEIKEILNQLNNIFKIMDEQKIIHNHLKPSNILLFMDNLNKIKFKLSDFGSVNDSINLNNNDIFLLTSPEVLNEEQITSKSNLWSLGIIIYYMLFKEYPFNAKSQIGIYKQIKSENKLKKINDKVLNDLVKKMLIINENDRISWNDYFNHPFFKENTIKRINDNKIIFPTFDFQCKKHSQILNSYCPECKNNICNLCLDEHKNHNIISFSNIGLNDFELEKIDDLMEELKRNINLFNENAKKIQSILNQMRLVNDNKLIYEEDSLNNFKDYYIKNLEFLVKKINFEEKIHFIDLNIKKNLKSKKENINNYIICKYEITESKINQPIQILNCYENAVKNNSWFKNKGIENCKEIKENCDLFLNGKKIPFSYEYKFPKKGKYTIKIVIKKPLVNINFMFCYCSSLILIDFSNFNSKEVAIMNNMFHFCSSLKEVNLLNFSTINVTDMSYLFASCSSLENLDLNDFNTINVKNMNNMFSKCSSLYSLYITNFNTINVTDMNGMFNGCSSILFLNIYNFNTEKVTDMSSMFAKCSSLIKIDISNFKTDNVINMRKMFFECFALNSIDLSNFNTKNVKDMDHMFSDCSSLTTLELTNFNTEKVTDMNNMFSRCSSLKLLDLTSFNTENVVNMKEMFSKSSSLKTLNLSSFKTSKVKDMSFMFSNCLALASLILYSFNTKNVKYIEGMFSNCTTIMTLDLSNFNTINIENMSSLFSNCLSLMNVNLTNFNTENVYKMNNMFSNCKSLTSLNLSNFNTNKLTEMYHMFYNCSSLTFLNLSNFNITNVKDMNGIFFNLNKDCKVISKQKKLLNCLNK